MLHSYMNGTGDAFSFWIFRENIQSKAKLSNGTIVLYSRDSKGVSMARDII